MEQKKISPAHLQDMLIGYIACAFWSSTDDAQEPLDARYDRGSLAPETLQAMEQDCELFANTHLALIEEFQAELSRYDWGYIGHDLWLTRNGHGAGFWDRIPRSQSDVGHRLSAFCGHGKAFPPKDLYVGDDGRLHLS